MTLTEKLKRLAVGTSIVALVGMPVWLRYLPKQDSNSFKIPVPNISSTEPVKQKKQPEQEKPIPDEGRIPFSAYQGWSYLFPMRDATVALLDKEDYGIPRLEDILRDTDKYPNAARSHIRGQIEIYKAWDERKDLRDAIKEKIKAQLTDYDGFMSEVKQGLQYWNKPDAWEPSKRRFSVTGKGIHTSSYITPETSLKELENITITPCEFSFGLLLDSKDRLLTGHYEEKLIGANSPLFMWYATFEPVTNGYFQNEAGYCGTCGPQDKPLVYSVNSLGEFGSGRHITDVKDGLLGALKEK